MWSLKQKLNANEILFSSMLEHLCRWVLVAEASLSCARTETKLICQEVTEKTLAGHFLGKTQAVFATWKQHCRFSTLRWQFRNRNFKNDHFRWQKPTQCGFKDRWDTFWTAKTYTNGFGRKKLLPFFFNIKDKILLLTHTFQKILLSQIVHKTYFENCFCVAFPASCHSFCFRFLALSNLFK